MNARRLIGLGVAVVAALAGANVFASTPPDSGPTTTITYPTVPPFTVVPTTTTTIVDPSSTTAAPTTTVTSPARETELIIEVDLTPAERAVVNALYEARIAFVDATLDPDAPGVDAQLDATHARSGQARRLIETIRRDERDLNIRVHLHPRRPSTMTVEAVRFYEEPYVRAGVQVCWVDTSITYQVAGHPDGSDMVLDDSIVATRGIYTMVPEEAAWQLWHTRRTSEQLRGVTECETV